MYQRAKNLWAILTDEPWQFDLYVQRPQKGCGYKGGGEYYLYKRESPDVNCEYVFSYSERGEEQIIIKSNNYQDIEFEMAYYMTSDIIPILIKKQRHKFKDGVDSQTRKDMQLELFSKCDSTMYQRAKRRFDNQMLR